MNFHTCNDCHAFFSDKTANEKRVAAGYSDFWGQREYSYSLRMCCPECGIDENNFSDARVCQDCEGLNETKGECCAECARLNEALV